MALPLGMAAATLPAIWAAPGAAPVSRERFAGPSIASQSLSRTSWTTSGSSGAAARARCLAPGVRAVGRGWSL